MATSLVSVETREVVRCEYCRLMQYRTSNSICRKCHKPLDFEEPALLAPQLVTSQPAPDGGEAGLQVAGQVREIAPDAPPEPAPTGGAHAGAAHLHLKN